MFLEGRQVQEAVLSLFHTLLFHRTLGKFHYKREGSYSVGTVGFEDISCDFVDFTYIWLEFFQKRRTHWLLPTENIPWEVWSVRVNVLSLPNEQERQKQRSSLGEQLSEKVVAVAASLNRHQYLPRVPSQPDLELVFDTRYRDVQPYHFKVGLPDHWAVQQPVHGSTVRKLLKDTLAF
ncbi:hypothetical protein HPB48_022095 [Haemaphysalis longicornis]|uniref:Autophagy-related protein 101 n=1 Tax=Haemaphysalis longicornis TaxID=44386 RepID=A0A9J6FXP8_HAELO|nr:hypothetical protein HPB48_022095 [Haemaphysalis longicornis]